MERRPDALVAGVADIHVIEHLVRTGEALVALATGEFQRAADRGVIHVLAAVRHDPGVRLFESGEAADEIDHAVVEIDIHRMAFFRGFRSGSALAPRGDAVWTSLVRNASSVAESAGGVWRRAGAIKLAIRQCNAKPAALA
jgi:hypothetical protein